MMNINNLDAQSLAVTVVIAVFVAVVTEVTKYFDKNEKLSARAIQLLTLVLGLIGGLIALSVFGGDFSTYVWLGLAGGVMSSGIYELVTKLVPLDLNK